MAAAAAAAAEAILLSFPQRGTAAAAEGNGLGGGGGLVGLGRRDRSLAWLGSHCNQRQFGSNVNEPKMKATKLRRV